MSVSRPKYFLFDADDQVVANTITDSNLAPLSRYGKGPKFYDQITRILHVPYLDTDADIVDVGQLPDIIGVGVEVALSKKAVECLSAFEFDSQIAFLPVEVVNRTSQQITSDYFLLFSNRWYNVLNISESDAIVFDDGSIDEISRWVFDADSLPGWDWFYAHQHSWVINEFVLQKFFERHISNFRLTEVRVLPS